MNSRNISISVIIPIYNRGYCLRRCLDSMVQQSFQDWECILIDDGSTDNTYEICEEYAMNDHRFVIYHQKNQGVSAARNKGLDIATGVYITFLDSDDYLDSNCLSVFYTGLGDCDLSVCGYNMHDKNEKLEYYCTHPAITFLLEPENEGILIQLYRQCLMYGPVCKLYKRSIIDTNAVRFRKGISYGEDVIFVYDYLLGVKNIRVIPDCLYNVVQFPGSLVANPHNQSFEKHMLRWEIAARFYEARGMHGKEVREYLSDCYLSVVWLGLYLVVLRHDTLSVFDRYAYVISVLNKVDMFYLDINTRFPKWKIFLMKRGRLYWALSEFKCLIKKIKRAKI